MTNNTVLNCSDTFTTEEGLRIAEKLSIPERTFKRLLTNKELFNPLKYGEYEKKS